SFFFSSRRRHTRFSRDWSSDVCSSDLHKVRILDEAITASVKLSARYIPGRQLPDKSVSLLDTACARVSLSQTGTPPPIEDHRRRSEERRVGKEGRARRAASRRSGERGA